MRFKKIIPFLFFFNSIYYQDWNLTNEKFIIEHKGKEYYSQIAKKNNLTCYYIYEKDNPNEIIGDDENEYNDYKEIAIAANMFYNKGNILRRINNNLEEFKTTNRSYKTGIILDETAREIAEFDVKMALALGGDFSIVDYVADKVTETFKGVKEAFIEEIFKEKSVVKGAENFAKNLKEKIFTSTALESKDNMHKLNELKNLLFRPKPLSTEEALEIDSLISECLVKGNQLEEFQIAYMKNINEIGYQLVSIGSTVLKSDEKGKFLYEVLRELGVNGIEDIKSDGLKRSKRGMQKVGERTYLSFNLYKKNFEPGTPGSLAYELINQFRRKEIVEEEKINNEQNNKIRKELNLDWHSGYSLEDKNDEGYGNVSISDNLIKLYAEAKNTDYTSEVFTFLISKNDLKNLEFNKLNISFNLRLTRYGYTANYLLGLFPIYDFENYFPQNGSRPNWLNKEFWIQYKMDTRNTIDLDGNVTNPVYYEKIGWNLEINKRNYQLIINNNIESKFSKTFYLDDLKKWYIGIILTDQENKNSSRYGNSPTEAIITDFKYEIEN